MIDQARLFLRHGPPPSISPEQIAKMVRDHELDILRGDEELRAKGMGLDFARPGSLANHDGLGMTDDDLRYYRYALDYLDDRFREQAAVQQTSASRDTKAGPWPISEAQCPDGE